MAWGTRRRGDDMTIALVQSIALNPSASISTRIFASPVTSGNTIVVCVNANAGATPPTSVTDSVGNTYQPYLTVVNPTNPTSAIWYADNVTGGASVQVTVHYSYNAQAQGFIAEISSTVGNLSPEVGHGNFDQTGPAIAGPITTTKAEEIGFCLVQVNGGGTALAAPSGWTSLEVVGGTQPSQISYQIFSTIQTAYTASWTIPGTVWSAGIATFAAQTPVAAFSGTPLTGTVSLSVAFTDASTGAPSSWLWIFGDGATSTAQNPTHSYATPGVYNVSLTATNSLGSSSLSKTAYVLVTPVAVTPQQSQSGRAVSLVAVSQGNVYVAFPGGGFWTAATNATGKTLATTGVVRSASNNQKLWYADGTTWLYYDPSVNSVLNWTASAGSLPGSNLTPVDFPREICTWRGRTVVSGIKGDPQNWFMSAVNDPTNWNYFPFPSVSTMAIAGNNSPLGLIGDVITCLIPYTDEILIFGGDHTIWMCMGDPASGGGSITLVSASLGMAWGNPWCMGPDGTIYFFSNKTGIYQFIPGQSVPVRMSQQIEQLLVNVDTGANIIRMQWNDSMQGFHTYITPTSGAAVATHLFWEIRTGAWWTDVFQSTNHNPLCCVTLDGNTPGDRHPLVGSWDGYVRSFDPTAASDDGFPVSSSVVIGPLLTKDLDDVLLKDIQGILGSASGQVTYAVYVGATAEIALASAPVSSGTWMAGRNLTSYVRRAGHAIYIKLTAASAWAMETIRARVAGQNKVRRRGY